MGKYIGNGDLSCQECNAGMYNDQEGQTSCKLCEDGKTTVKGTNSACATPVMDVSVNTLVTYASCDDLQDAFSQKMQSGTCQC